MTLRPPAGEYRNQVVRIPDLTVNTPMLEDLAFENCKLLGPAIIVPLSDTEISNCTWNAPSFESVIWVIPDDREVVVGAVGLVRCRLHGCTLQDIGLGVKQSQLDEVRRGMGL